MVPAHARSWRRSAISTDSKSSAWATLEGSGTTWNQVQSQATPIMMNRPSTTGLGEGRRSHSATARAISESPAMTTTDHGKAPPKSCGEMITSAQRTAVSGAAKSCSRRLRLEPSSRAEVIVFLVLHFGRGSTPPNRSQPLFV